MPVPTSLPVPLLCRTYSLDEYRSNSLKAAESIDRRRGMSHNDRDRGDEWSLLSMFLGGEGGGGGRREWEGAESLEGTDGYRQNQKESFAFAPKQALSNEGRRLSNFYTFWSPLPLKCLFRSGGLVASPMSTVGLGHLSGLPGGSES
uniref:Uncharacterized protein n=1 Tax=Globodera rostochiensis TaxID=31243 RepID=A0A914H027_GLORO